MTLLLVVGRGKLLPGLLRRPESRFAQARMSDDGQRDRPLSRFQISLAASRIAQGNDLSSPSGGIDFSSGAPDSLTAKGVGDRIVRNEVDGPTDELFQFILQVKPAQ